MDSSTTTASREMMNRWLGLLKDLTYVRLPRTVIVEDYRWGLLNVLAVTMAMSVVFMLYQDSLEAKYTVTGEIYESWISGSAMSGAKALAEPYCASPPSEGWLTYFYCDRKDPENEFWCDDVVDCALVEPSEASWKQSSRDIWAVTMVKETTFIRATCTSLVCAIGELRTNLTDGTCQCKITRNRFLAGAEHLEYRLRFRPVVDGYGPVEKMEGEARATSFVWPIEMFIYRLGPDGKRDGSRVPFSPGGKHAWNSTEELR